MDLNRGGNAVYSWVGDQWGSARFQALVQLTSTGNTLTFVLHTRLITPVSCWAADKVNKTL